MKYKIEATLCKIASYVAQRPLYFTLYDQSFRKIMRHL